MAITWADECRSLSSCSLSSLVGSGTRFHDSSSAPSAPEGIAGTQLKVSRGVRQGHKQ